MAVFYQNVDPDTPLSKNIGFNARSVLVDNYTAFYLYFPDADAYVPPFYIGVVLPLLHTTDYARFLPQSPFGGDQAPVINSYFVHTVWTDALLSPAPGFLINDPNSPVPTTIVSPDFTNPPDANHGVFPAISVANSGIVNSSFPQTTPSNVHKAIFQLRVTANPGGGSTLDLEIMGSFPAVASELIVFAGLATAVNADFIAVLGPGVVPADWNGADVVPTAVRNGFLPSEYSLNVRPQGGGNWGYQLNVMYGYM